MKSTVFINNKKINGFKDTKELLSKIKNYKGLLIAVGIEKLLNDDKNFEKIINSNFTYPDGIGAVFALKRKGITSKKIPGAKLWLQMIEKYYKNKTFFLLGAKKEILEIVIDKLTLQFKGIKIVGYHHGYYDDEKSVINSIKKLKPDIIFTALGSPKQEFLMQKSFNSHPALYMGLGGSFDLYSGKIKDVPLWWNKYFKYEGLYRLFLNFGNLRRWKRQLIIFKFLKALLQKKI